MPEHYFIIKNIRIIDGEGGPPVENGWVTVKNGRILAVGETGTEETPPEAGVVDGRGLTLLPGLIDSHLHLQGTKTMNPLELVTDPPEMRAIRSVMDLWRIIDMGFTTIRDCGENHALYLKQAVAEGKIIGPRILSCGTIITQTGGHGDPAHSLPLEWVRQRTVTRVADGVDECRKAAREQLRKGADFIKMCTTGGVMSEKDHPSAGQFSVEEIRALVEEAHRAGVKASSHAQGVEGIKNALKAGVDVIEHGSFADREAVDMMLENKAYLVATLSLGQTLADKGMEVGVAEIYVQKAKKVFETKMKSFEMTWKSGVKIGVGTDFLSEPLCTMGDNALEMELQVKAGRPVMDVIVSATKINAEILGIEEKAGTIKPGKQADLVLINGDPLSDISILRRREKIVKVFKEGREVPRLPEGVFHW